jgi:hypothetical protein
MSVSSVGGGKKKTYVKKLQEKVEKMLLNFERNLGQRERE